MLINSVANFFANVFRNLRQKIIFVNLRNNFILKNFFENKGMIANTARNFPNIYVSTLYTTGTLSVQYTISNRKVGIFSTMQEVLTC